MSKLISVNPFRLEVIEKFDELNDLQIEEKIDQSDVEFRKYRMSSFSERREKMKNLSTLLLEEKEDLARCITNEMGKLLKESID